MKAFFGLALAAICISNVSAHAGWLCGSAIEKTLPNGNAYFSDDESHFGFSIFNGDMHHLSQAGTADVTSKVDGTLVYRLDDFAVLTVYNKQPNLPEIPTPFRGAPAFVATLKVEGFPTLHLLCKKN